MGSNSDFDRLFSKNTNKKVKRARKRDILFDYGDCADSSIVATIYENEQFLDKNDFTERIQNFPSNPFKILDARGILNDFYLNHIDWSSDGIISIILDDSLVFYNTKTKSVKEILNLKQKNEIFGSDATFSSVKFNKKNSVDNLLGVGQSDGIVNIVDMETYRSAHQFKNSENAKVNVMDWNENILSVGLESGEIVNYDVRDWEKISQCKKHAEQICSLKYSNDGRYLASGGNDDIVKISNESNFGRTTLEFKGHQSAVKAMSWCPWLRDTITTGGGLNDKTVKRWDTITGEIEASRKLESPVTYLNYIERHKEIVVMQGVPNNSVSLLKADSLEFIKNVGVHEQRILSGASSFDGRFMASVGADENLIFWEVLEQKEEKKDPIFSWLQL